ncbi:MAG: hypothetical protein ACJAZ3_000644 [Sphingobacteriales bacterium]|jgi:hypothetical protein
MYPYHNKIKQWINIKELVKFEYVDSYKNISPCLVLHFSTEPLIRPIKEQRFDEYEEYSKRFYYKNERLTF